MSDLISRQAAIDAIKGEIEINGYSHVVDVLKQLPPAQPETHEERTETHTCDCISRQAAIDAILAVTGNSSVRELYEHVQEHGLSDMWSGGVNAAIDIIIAVPSAQPEPHWIPCSKRLPEEDTKVLISYRYKEGEGDTNHVYIDITTYGQMYFGGNKVGDYKHWRAPFEYFESNYEVIAWMPLPEPYKEGES